MSLLSSFDDVIMKVMCWHLSSFLGIDTFLQFDSEPVYKEKYLKTEIKS